MLHVKNKFDAGRNTVHVLASRTTAPRKSKTDFRKGDLDTGVYKDNIHRFSNAKIPLSPQSCSTETVSLS